MLVKKNTKQSDTNDKNSLHVPIIAQNATLSSSSPNKNIFLKSQTNGIILHNETKIDYRKVQQTLNHNNLLQKQLEIDKQREIIEIPVSEQSRNANFSKVAKQSVADAVTEINNTYIKDKQVLKDFIPTTDQLHHSNLLFKQNMHQSHNDIVIIDAAPSYEQQQYQTPIQQPQHLKSTETQTFSYPEQITQIQPKIVAKKQKQKEFGTQTVTVSDFNVYAETWQQSDQNHGIVSKYNSIVGKMISNKFQYFPGADNYQITDKQKKMLNLNDAVETRQFRSVSPTKHQKPRIQIELL